VAIRSGHPAESSSLVNDNVKTVALADVHANKLREMINGVENQWLPKKTGLERTTLDLMPFDPLNGINIFLILQRLH
jgi:malate synthase